MEELKSFCEKIAFICRVRYEVYTSECPNSDKICEQLDESLYVIYQNMETTFSLNKENIELFLKFFWDCLEETEVWQMSVEKFGKDFGYTKDFLEDCFNNICQ